MTFLEISGAEYSMFRQRFLCPFVVVYETVPKRQSAFRNSSSLAPLIPYPLLAPLAVLL